MYIPEPYQERRREVLVEAIKARSFGTLITLGARGVDISHIPFALVEDVGETTLVAHLARANPQWRDVATSRNEAVASFLIGDAYISPGWYPSKTETGRVVPTWNYIAVEARGNIELVEDAPSLRDLLERLTQPHEADQPAPWSLADAPGPYLDALLRAIVGVRLRVRQLTGAWKLDQKKSAEDRAGAARGLSERFGDNVIARLMTPGSPRLR
jgi:transcriptional regulator